MNSLTLGLDGGPQQPKEAMRRSKQQCEAATTSDRAFNRVFGAQLGPIAGSPSGAV
jgi:hypothetical protein